MNIFHVELHARTHSFFSWWTPPEPLLDGRDRGADASASATGAPGR